MAAAKQSFDPGLTQQFTGELRRAINKDGSFNVRRVGKLTARRHPYLFLVEASWPKFIAIVFLSYLVVNLLFACVFVAIGIEHLVGETSNTGVGPFLSAFFFSVHTLTTVGYGSMYPRGLAGNSVAAIEAMTGLMGFALATGLLFARFSRPNAKILFSKSMVVAPYQDITGLEFRLANLRSNVLMDLEVKLILMTVEWTEGEARRKYAELALEREKVYFIPLTWTIVHPIDAGSPLFGLGQADLARKDAEFLVVLKGFDETFSQFVHARFSYRHEEILWGARFTAAFRVDPHGDMVLELDRIHDTRPADLPSLGPREIHALPEAPPAV